MRRYRWFVAILLAGAILAMCAAVTAIRFIVPPALARHPEPVGAAVSSVPRLDLQAHEQPPENMRDLAQKIMDLSMREEGLYKPFELVRIGERDYLILISGFQADSEGGNDLESVVQEVTKESSPYLRQVRAVIEQHIPLGSSIHLAGHSLGGMLANTLATTPDFLDRYDVKTVTTFAAPANSCPNPDVVYHRYVVEGDLVPLVHRAAIWSRIKGPLEVLKSTCVGDYTYLEQTMVDHSAGPNGMKNAHSSYEHSQDLIGEPLPFRIERYELIGRFEGVARGM